ncbi:MAG: transposase family protein [Pseudonocardiaceae bacterium]
MSHRRTGGRFRARSGHRLRRCRPARGPTRQAAAHRPILRPLRKPEPVPGNQHDMAKLKESECEMILKLAGDVIGDKGFIGTDYIITPVRKPQDRDLYMREHDYNNQISSLRAPVERAVANLKTWRILFTDYRRSLKTFLSSFRAAIGLYFFKEGFA